MKKGQLVISAMLLISILTVFVALSPQVYAGVNDTECTATNGNTQGGGQWWWAYQIKTNATALSVYSISVNPADAGGYWKAALYTASVQTLSAGNPDNYISGSYAGPYSIPSGGFHAEIINGTVNLSANTYYWIVTAFSSGTSAIFGKGTPCNQYFAHIPTGDYTGFPHADVGGDSWSAGGESTGLYMTLQQPPETTTTTTITTTLNSTSTTTTNTTYTTYNSTQTNTSTFLTNTTTTTYTTQISTTNFTTTTNATSTIGQIASTTTAQTVVSSGADIALSFMMIAGVLIVAIVVIAFVINRRNQGGL